MYEHKQNVHTQTARQTSRQAGRQADRQRHKQIEAETDRDADTETQRHLDTQGTAGWWPFSNATNKHFGRSPIASPTVQWAR